MSFSNADTGDKPADPFKQQNVQEPSLKEKVTELGSFVDRCKFCMMTSRSPQGVLASRCMALAGKEDHGVDFIFHTNTESGKTDDLQQDPQINLGFLNNAGEWASISGKAEIITDREKVRAFYTPTLKVWLGDLGDGKHDGGPEDPRIAVIKVNSETANYSVSNKGFIGSVVATAQSVAQGTAPAVNKIAYISGEELQQVRSGGVS